jgi:hypothetical protein
MKIKSAANNEKLANNAKISAKMAKYLAASANLSGGVKIESWRIENPGYRSAISAPAGISEKLWLWRKNRLAKAYQQLMSSANQQWRNGSIMAIS